MDYTIPEPPSWLEPEAKTEWRRIVKSYGRVKNFLSTLDVQVLIRYCQSFARVKQAEKIISEEGLTFSTPSGYVQQRPEISISQTYMKRMSEAGALLGLSPSDRARLAMRQENNEDDEMEEILNE